MTVISTGRRASTISQPWPMLRRTRTTRCRVLQIEQFFQVGDLRDAQFLGTLRADLSRIAIDRLAAGEDQVVVADRLDRLGQNVAGGQRVAGRRPAIGQQNRSIRTAKQAGTQDIRRFGRPHGQGGHRSPEPVPHLQRRFQRVEIFGIEDGRQGTTVDRAVRLHGLGRDIGRVRDLFDQDNTVIRQRNRSPLAGIHMTTENRPDYRAWSGDGSRPPKVRKCSVCRRVRPSAAAAVAVSRPCPVSCITVAAIAWLQRPSVRAIRSYSVAPA